VRNLKIIAINGAKNSGKEIVAHKLAENSDCIWVKPYTDKANQPNLEEYEQDEYIRLNEPKLSAKMEREIPLCISEINGHRWVFFETQFRAGFCVIIADDRVIRYLKKNWDGELYTIRCHSKNESESERFNLPDNEFDIVFNVDNDEIDLLEELVCDIYDYMEGDL